ncbi:hypothetical protein Hanom_Chr15g01394911 [Helianthus anomalus]
MRYKVQTTEDHPCTFGKSWRRNALQSANHRDHLYTFKKLRTNFKTLVNHRNLIKKSSMFKNIK